MRYSLPNSSCHLCVPVHRQTVKTLSPLFSTKLRMLEHSQRVYITKATREQRLFAIKCSCVLYLDVSMSDYTAHMY